MLAVNGQPSFAAIMVAFSAAALGALSARSHAAPSGAAGDISVSIDPATTVGISQFATGVTHTHKDLDPWQNAAAVASAKLLLQASTVYQNQHLMGWGADNPEPAPGRYNWESLDRRLKLIRETGGKLVITLCGAPDWMKGGRPDETDWSKLEVAPLPEHYQDFANLAAAVARRYPDVEYFQVWNELKGFYLPPPANRWDYEGYTRLYNLVYDAIRKVRARARIGGPYVVMDSWSEAGDGNRSSAVSGPYGTLDQRALDVVTYWLRHKRGADFIAVDGGTDNKDNVWITDEFTAGRKFADVSAWIRSLDDAQYPGAKTLPIWWAEWYASPSSDWRDLDHCNAVMASDLIATLEGGAATALVWQPQGDQQGFALPEGLWTDTRGQAGGKPTPFYYTQKGLHDYFGPGVALCRAASSSPRVGVLASTAKAMLVNRTGQPLTAVVNGRTVPLRPYQVVFVDTPAPLPEPPQER